MSPPLGTSDADEARARASTSRRARARDGAHGDANDARADRAIVADVDAMSRFARGVECGRRLGRTATRHPRARLEGSPRDENRARALYAGWTRVSSRRVMHNATRAPPRARWMEEVCVRVAYRGATHAVDVPSDATVGDLGVALERATGASVATQKIFGLKRVSSLKGGVLVPSRAGDATLAVASVPGLTSSANAKPLMLMGTAAADIAALDAASQVDHRVVGFDEELLRLRRRRKGHVSRGSSRAADSGPPSSAEHPYTFGEYRSLPVPDAIRPSAAAALRMLHKLARDPGILGVMAKHKFRVGLLSEMPPEGKVGVSESCVLGYNVNAGAEIHLRLRTDDLRGFRRYARVRETLLHELTHNVWSDHDGNFKALCSRLNAECAEFDWKANGNGARRLAGDGAIASSDEETWSEDETMAATRGSSGRASGGGGDDAPRSAAEAAARRAAAAAAEAAERDMATLARDAIEAAFARRGGGDVPRDANVAGSKRACGACGAGPFEVSAACPRGVQPKEAPTTSSAPKPTDTANASSSPPFLDPTAASANASAVRRAAVACDAIVAAAASTDDAIVALETLHTLLSNAADAPRGDAGAKYRRVRVANPAFRRRAGRFPGAMDALRAAGFRDDASDGEPALRLMRDDPALLYVVRSTVADAAESARRDARE